MAVSLEQKISLAFLLIGALMLVVTLAEPNWFKGAALGGAWVHMGLWKICGEYGTDDCVSLDGSPGWITGPEVLECISLSCVIGAVAHSFRMFFHKTRVICVLAAFLAALSGFLGLVGALVFQKAVALDVADWCFYVNIVADVFMMVSGILLAFHVFRMTRSGYHHIN